LSLGSAFLSDKQKQWLHAQKIFMKLKPARPPKVPENRQRKFFFNLVMSKYFRYAINIVIAANVVSLSLLFYGAPEELHKVVSISNYVFLGIYGLEAIFKILGLGPNQYFGIPGRMSWTLFEFMIVVGTFAGTTHTIPHANFFF